jgi:penicillin-insensitive murein endopeptidase
LVEVARRRTPFILVLAALQTVGCFGSPTPLAPGLKGSVGLPHQGVLTDSAELPLSGPGYRRYRPFGTRNYGTPQLVSAVIRAGQAVQRELPNSPPLVVGDLSARWGGKVSGHSSHRTGRDVDLLFFATNLEAIPVTSPGFIHFGADGLSRLSSGTYVALDVHRNWLVARALLTDPTIDVQWLFVSRDVEAFLIDHARALGEDSTLVLKAERVLHQPRDSANHDDHFHVRIACAPDERALGCEGGGPAWPWLRANTAVTTPNLVLPWDYEDAPIPGATE